MTRSAETCSKCDEPTHRDVFDVEPLYVQLLHGDRIGPLCEDCFRFQRAMEHDGLHEAIAKLKAENKRLRKLVPKAWYEARRVGKLDIYGQEREFRDSNASKELEKTDNDREAVGEG